MWYLLLLPIINFLPLQTNPPNWTTDFDAAVEAAYESETEKFVFVFFTGSDWCIPCKRLKREVLDHETFWKYADEKLILVKIDFPEFKKNKLPKWQEKYNEGLADDYNTDRVFPFIAIVNEHEELVGTVMYNNETPLEFVKKIETTLR